MYVVDNTLRAGQLFPGSNGHVVCARFDSGDVHSLSKIQTQPPSLADGVVAANGLRGAELKPSADVESFTGLFRFEDRLGREEYRSLT